MLVSRSAMEGESAAKPVGPYRCLVIDRSRVRRGVARRILEELNCEIEEADTANAALRLFRESSPDLVLLDWMLPEMSGLDLLRQLRASPAGDRARFLFCTPQVDADHLREIVGAGADEYVGKPYDSDVIHSRLLQLGFMDA